MAKDRLADRLGPQILLVWAGLALGVAFVAPPAKFLAPSLTLPVALDVGRHTFAVYNRLELVVAFCLLALGGWSHAKARWYAALAVPALIVLVQAVWLIPALDRRVAAILAGARALPRSNMHGLYIGLEAVKIAALLGFGVARRDAATAGAHRATLVQFP